MYAYLLQQTTWQKMGDDSSLENTNTRRRRRCGYQYMTPSYELDDDDASYPQIAHALLENSSAHGFPTLYRAQGNSHSTSDFYSHNMICEICDLSVFDECWNLDSKQYASMIIVICNSSY